MTAYKMTCRKCKRIFTIGEETWGNLCDSCAGVVRGLPGTPIAGFGIDKNALRRGADYADVATGEITHYTPPSCDNGPVQNDPNSDKTPAS